MDCTAPDRVGARRAIRPRGNVSTVASAEYHPDTLATTAPLRARHANVRQCLTTLQQRPTPQPHDAFAHANGAVPDTAKALSSLPHVPRSRCQRRTTLPSLLCTLCPCCHSPPRAAGCLCGDHSGGETTEPRRRRKSAPLAHRDLPLTRPPLASPPCRGAPTI